MARKEVEFTRSQINELVGLYTQGMTEEQIASFFGITEQALKRFIKKRHNADLRQRIKSQRIAAIAKMRQSLYTKGIGISFREGTPRVIEDGKVTEEGQAASLAIPGSLSAMKFWMINCDEEKEWKDIRQTQLAGPDGEKLFDQVSNMNEKELINIVIDAIKEGIVPLDKVLPLAQNEGRRVEANYKIVK